MKEKKAKKSVTTRDKFLDEFKTYFNTIFEENKDRERNVTKKFLITLTFIKIMEKSGWVNKDLLPTLLSDDDYVAIDAINDLTNLNISYLDNFFKSEIFRQEDNFLNFLDRYNYSAKELDDKDIITPEILSNIFEGMLEDTKKDGTTYTPKEIVEYMTQSSIIEFLKTNLPEIETSIIDDIYKNETINLPNDVLSKMIISLDNMTTCDPAVGCGVFPLGMINELCNLKEKIHKALNISFSSYDTKKTILERNIYGVDIEEMAIYISHLRLNLFLNSNETQFKGFVNLLYKIVKGNSLINIVDNQAINIDWEVEDEELSKFLIDAIKQNCYYQQKYLTFKGNKEEKLHINKTIYDNKLVILNKILTYNNKKLSNSGFKNKKEQATILETIKSNEYVLNKINEYGLDNTKKFDLFDWTLDFAHIQNPLLFLKNKQ